MRNKSNLNDILEIQIFCKLLKPMKPPTPLPSSSTTSISSSTTSISSSSTELPPPPPVESKC